MKIIKILKLELDKEEELWAIRKIIGDLTDTDLSNRFNLSNTEIEAAKDIHATLHDMLG